MSIQVDKKTLKLHQRISDVLLITGVLMLAACVWFVPAEDNSELANASEKAEVINLVSNLFNEVQNDESGAIRRSLRNHSERKGLNQDYR